MRCKKNINLPIFLIVPDGLQCASFRIPKLYDISELKSDILVFYKCKARFTSVSYERPMSCCSNMLFLVVTRHHFCEFAGALCFEI